MIPMMPRMTPMLEPPPFRRRRCRDRVVSHGVDLHSVARASRDSSCRPSGDLARIVGAGPSRPVRPTLQNRYSGISIRADHARPAGPRARRLPDAIGYAGRMSFSTEDLDLLDGREEVEIETQAPGQGGHTDDHLGRRRRRRGLRPVLHAAPARAGTATSRPTPPSRSMSTASACRRRRSRHRPRLDRADERRLPAQVRRRSRAPRSMVRPDAPRDRRFGSSPPDREPREAPMYFDEFKHQLPDIDPAETEDWLASLDQVVEQEGESRARFLVYKLLKRARQLQVGLPPLTQTRYINTISPEQEPSFPGDEADGAADPADHPLERRGDGPARQQPVLGDRRPPRDVRLARRACTRSASTTSSGARTTSQAGDQIFYQGHAAPGIYARAFLEGRLTEDQLDHFRRETVPGEGLPLVPAPAAHARLLGVPDGLDGPRADQRDLPGPLQPLPPEPRPARHVGLARLGVPRRRRDRRARVARGAPRRRPRGPRQPDLRRQLQPAAPRRPGPRQRQDHPGARGGRSAAPAGTSSRSSGPASGTSSSPATSTASSSSR